MEVNKTNELIGKIQGAKTSFKYLATTGKLTGSQFVAYCDLIDNMKELGIDTVIKTQEYFLNEDELSYYYDTPDKLGNVFIEDEKLYFRNIQRMVDGKNLYYRISNYYTNKEYKAGQSYIFSIKPEQLDSSKYTIHGDEDYVVLNEAPLVGEIVTISNEK